MAKFPTIQLSVFCEVFAVDIRPVRYILEEGFVPKGVEHSPNTGTRREFGPGHAFWLAIVLKLKQSGLQTALAADVADFAHRALHAVAQNLVWDLPFKPADGYFDTDHQYFLDVGDRKYMRLVTDACPDPEGLYEFDWLTVKGEQTTVKNIKPFVVVRVDLTKICKILAQIPGWMCQRFL